jgi:putative membrane protein
VIHLLISWMLSALALWLVAQILPGIKLRDFGTALLATIVIAVVNVIVGWPLKFIAIPITFLTLGLFLLVINAFLLKLASILVPGFAIRGFLAAFLGSIVLTVLNWLLRRIVFGGPGWF